MRVREVQPSVRGRISMWSGCFVASALLWTASVALAQELGDGGRLRAAMGQPRPFERPLPAIAERAAPAPERQAAPPTPAAKPLPTVVAASALVVPAQEGPQQHKRAVLRLRDSCGQRCRNAAKIPPRRGPGVCQAGQRKAWGLLAIR